jgi:hypothetical protein
MRENIRQYPKRSDLLPEPHSRTHDCCGIQEAGKDRSRERNFRHPCRSPAFSNGGSACAVGSASAGRWEDVPVGSVSLLDHGAET